MAETQTQESPGQQQEQQQEQQQRELAKAQPQRAPIARTSRGVDLKSFGELVNYSKCIADSGLAPKGFESYQAILVAIEAGAEVGLRPLQALQNIAVINGRPQFYGDIPLAIVQASGELEDFQEYMQGDGSDLTAVCVSKRRNRSKPCTRTFSVKDAITAGLWGKAGPWKQYPKRMLQMRARGFNLRDEFPDILKGFASEIHPDEVIDVVPQPDGQGGMVYASRSDALAAQMEAAKGSAKDVQPPPASTRAAAGAEDGPGEDEVPTDPSAEKPLSDLEKVLIEASERWKMSQAAAEKIIDTWCAKMGVSPMAQRTGKALQEIKTLIQKGSIKP